MLRGGGESGAICRELGISEQSYYRRRGEYGGLKVSQARPFERVGERDPTAQESCFNLTLDALILKEVVEGKVLSPSRCKDAVDHVQAALGCSERRACRVIGQPRSTQRRLVVIKPDEQPLTAEISRLAQRYGRYGYRRITGLLRNSGWHVNAKRVERIWRREGLKVPKQQPKRGRLWFNDGSCVRLRPQYKGHVWSYDFVMDRTHDGRAFRMLTVIDEYSRECLAIHVQRKLNSDDVLAVLADLVTRHGPPAHIRSDNGAEFTAHAVQDWLARIGVKNSLYRTGITLGERLQRKLQRQTVR